MYRMLHVQAVLSVWEMKYFLGKCAPGTYMIPAHNPLIQFVSSKTSGYLKKKKLTR